MSTLAQEVKHAVSHFFGTYLFLGFLMKVYFPTESFIRKLWWKAWGHDPENNINFHLSKISTSTDSMNKALLFSIVVELCEWLYGKEGKYSSAAFNQLLTFSRFHYLKYSQYMAIVELYQNDLPGQAVIDWVVKVDGLKTHQFNVEMQRYPAFCQWHKETLEKRWYV